MLPLRFEALAGDRIRVAISWWARSTANPLPIYWDGGLHYWGNDLSINLDLVIRSPSNQMVASSATWSNNYELVDFITPETGTYTIEISRTESTDTTNEVGVAITRVHRNLLPIEGRNF